MAPLNMTDAQRLAWHLRAQRLARLGVPFFDPRPAIPHEHNGRMTFPSGFDQEDDG